MRIDGAALAFGCPPHYRQIDAFEAPVAAVSGELLGETLMRCIGLRHHQEPRRILVEAMHDARAPDTADAGEALTAMGDERIDEGARLVAGGRMDDKSGRLVDDDQGVVLIYYVKIDEFGQRLGRDRRRQAHQDMLARLHLAAGFGDRRPLDSDTPIGNKGLKSRPAHFRELARQEAVEPIARSIGRDGRFRRWARCRRLVGSSYGMAGHGGGYLSRLRMRTLR